MTRLIYEWGSWTFEPGEWRLSNAAAGPVSLPNRTLDLLALLLDRSPRLVTKDEILSHVWKDSVVEEGNIAFHIGLLRKTLDDSQTSCIETVRGRGYRFVTPLSRRIVEAEGADLPVAPPHVTEPTPTAPPRRPRSLVVPVAAGLVLGGVVVAAAWVSWPTSSPAIRSLVVLPSTDGLAEAVAARISHDTRLAARVGTAGDRSESPAQAGQRLRAEAVLTTRVDHDVRPRRVWAHLTRTRDQQSLWSWAFDVPMETPAALNAAIAASIGFGLARHLGVARSTSDQTLVNPAAYDLALQAREQWRQRTPHAIQQAIVLYQRAIAIEPSYARAHAGLADCYNLTMSGLPPQVRYAHALEHATTAVTLDPADAAGHTSLAFLRYKFEWKWHEADEEFSRALALDPEYALAHHWYGEYLGLMGRYDQAITHLQKAIALEPQSLAILNDLVPPLLRAGRVSEARAVLEDAAAINPNWPFIPYRMAEVFAAEGREREAVESHWRWMLLTGASLEAVDRLRAAYNSGGLHAMIRVEIAGYLDIEARSPTAWLNATSLGRAYARLGDRREALRWIGVALERREDTAIILLTHPDYDPIRDDPEFGRQLANLGLTPLAGQQVGSIASRRTQPRHRAR